MLIIIEMFHAIRITFEMKRTNDKPHRIYITDLLDTPTGNKPIDLITLLVEIY